MAIFASLKRLHYAWIIVAGSVAVLAIHSLTVFSFGIFLKPVTSEFGWERGAFSLAVSITILGSGFLSILTGRISDRYGPRWLVTGGGILVGLGFVLMSRITELWQVYLIFGLLIAVGSAALVVPVVSTVARWFAVRRGVAMGLTFSGMALGAMIGPVMTNSLIDGQGWRGGYLVLGLTSLILTPLVAQVLRRDPQVIGVRPYGEDGALSDGSAGGTPETSLSLSQAMRTTRFWLLGSMLFCVFFVHQMIMAHLAPHGIDGGMAPAAAATVVSAVGAANLVGRNMAGFLSDRIGARRYLTASLLATVLALAWLQAAGGAWMLFLFAAIYGIAQGGFPISHTLALGNAFGLRHLGAIMAGMMVMGSIGGSVGAPLAGAIYDSQGSYQNAFIIALVMATLALLLSLLLLRSRRPAGRSNQPSPS